MIYTYIYILFCLSVSDKVFNYFPNILPPAKTTKICHYAKKETLNQETISQSSPEEKTFLSVFSFIFQSVSMEHSQWCFCSQTLLLVWGWILVTAYTVVSRYSRGEQKSNQELKKYISYFCCL